MAHSTCSYSPAKIATDPFTRSRNLCETRSILHIRGLQTYCFGLERSPSKGNYHKTSFPSVFANAYFRINPNGSLHKNGVDSKSSKNLIFASNSEVGGIGRGGIGGENGGNSNNGGGSGWGRSDSGGEERNSGGLLGLFLQGWRQRVEADPQFPFKVLMEEVVGVSSNVLGDMATRPNFGLNELDFVFCTLVVGSLMNFILMYMLAPTSVGGGGGLPGMFSSCPSSHMFETGPYGLIERLGTFVYKGALFSVAGFGAGLVGTALSNALISTREKMDPKFVSPNKPPPPLLNASTWALHMAFSSNFRYQALNGIEFLLAKGLHPVVFKASVIVLRCMNNVIGGMSFVLLARLTGSQKVESSAKEEQVIPCSSLESKDTADDTQHNKTC